MKSHRYNRRQPAGDPCLLPPIPTSRTLPSPFSRGFLNNTPTTYTYAGVIDQDELYENDIDNAIVLPEVTEILIDGLPTRPSIAEMLCKPSMAQPSEQEKLPAIESNTGATRNEHLRRYISFVSAAPFERRPPKYRQKQPVKRRQLLGPEECFRCQLRLDHAECQRHKFIRVNGSLRHSFWYVQNLIDAINKENVRRLNQSKDDAVTRREEMLNHEQSHKRRVKIYIEKKDGTRVSQYIFVTDAEYKRLKKDYSFAQKILNLEDGDEIVDFKASKKRFVENDSGKMVKVQKDKKTPEDVKKERLQDFKQKHETDRFTQRKGRTKDKDNEQIGGEAKYRSPNTTDCSSSDEDRKRRKERMERRRRRSTTSQDGNGRRKKNNRRNGWSRRQSEDRSVRGDDAISEERDSVETSSESSSSDSDGDDRMGRRPRRSKKKRKKEKRRMKRRERKKGKRKRGEERQDEEDPSALTHAGKKERKVRTVVEYYSSASSLTDSSSDQDKKKKKTGKKKPKKESSSSGSDITWNVESKKNKKKTKKMKKQRQKRRRHSSAASSSSYDDSSEEAEEDEKEEEEEEEEEEETEDSSSPSSSSSEDSSSTDETSSSSSTSSSEESSSSTSSTSSTESSSEVSDVSSSTVDSSDLSMEEEEEQEEDEEKKEEGDDQDIPAKDKIEIKAQKKIKKKEEKKIAKRERKIAMKKTEKEIKRIEEKKIKLEKKLADEAKRKEKNAKKKAKKLKQTEMKRSKKETSHQVSENNERTKDQEDNDIGVTDQTKSLHGTVSELEERDSLSATVSSASSVSSVATEELSDVDNALPEEETTAIKKEKKEKAKEVKKEKKKEQKVVKKKELKKKEKKQKKKKKEQEKIKKKIAKEMDRVSISPVSSVRSSDVTSSEDEMKKELTHEEKQMRRKEKKKVIKKKKKQMKKLRVAMEIVMKKRKKKGKTDPFSVSEEEESLVEERGTIEDGKTMVKYDKGASRGLTDPIEKSDPRGEEWETEYQFIKNDKKKKKKKKKEKKERTLDDILRDLDAAISPQPKTTNRFGIFIQQNLDILKQEDGEAAGKLQMTSREDETNENQDEGADEDTQENLETKLEDNDDQETMTSILSGDEDDFNKVKGSRKINRAFRRRAEMLLPHLEKVLRSAEELQHDEPLAVTKVRDGIAPIIDEKVGTIDYLSHFRLVEQTKLDPFGRAFVVGDENFDCSLSFDELQEALDGVPSLVNIKPKQIKYVLKILNLDEHSIVSFKMFSVVAAICERMCAMDPFDKQLVDKSDLLDLERKMELYKAMFYCNIDPDRSSNFIPADALRIELKAGGLNRWQEEYVMSRMSTDYDEISFFDYMAYIPLFLSMHENIIENPLDREEKFNHPTNAQQRDMNPLGFPLSRTYLEQAKQRMFGDRLAKLTKNNEAGQQLPVDDKDNINK